MGLVWCILKHPLDFRPLVCDRDAILIGGLFIYLFIYFKNIYNLFIPSKDKGSTSFSFSQTDHNFESNSRAPL